jgi:hypothetical protein
VLRYVFEFPLASTIDRSTSSNPGSLDFGPDHPAKIDNLELLGVHCNGNFGWVYRNVSIIAL